MHSGNVMSECSNLVFYGVVKRKLMVVSVVVGAEYVNLRLDGFRSRKFIHPLFSYVGLSFMSVCI